MMMMMMIIISITMIIIIVVVYLWQEDILLRSDVTPRGWLGIKLPVSMKHILFRKLLFLFHFLLPHVVAELSLILSVSVSLFDLFVLFFFFLSVRLSPDPPPPPLPAAPAPPPMFCVCVCVPVWAMLYVDSMSFFSRLVSFLIIAIFSFVSVLFFIPRKKKNPLVSLLLFLSYFSFL